MDQQQLLLQQQQQAQQNQQQFLLLQQLQKQAQNQQEKGQQQAASVTRLPSNMDHIRSPGANFPGGIQQQSLNPMANLNLQHQGTNLGQNAQQPQTMKGIRPSLNQAELQMAYQDAWRVCHPDFKRPFSSLEDACERLLPYHVVADYEAEEDDRILDSDTTGHVLSRSQQWDNNIEAKVAEFTATFEKQVLAFNIMTQKRAQGEFRGEERLMIEQALLQDEKRALLELKAEMDAREKATREAQLRMATTMVQADQGRVGLPPAHAEMMARASSMRNSALGSQERASNPGAMMNGWGGSGIHRDEKDQSDDFLNDDDAADHADVAAVHGDWRDVGDFDLNIR